MKLTQVRAKEIVAQARDKAVHGPWCDQLDKVMSAEERDQVLFHWDTLDGSTNFVNALYDFVEGKVDKEYFYPTIDPAGKILSANATVRYKLIPSHNWEDELAYMRHADEKWEGTAYIDTERCNVWYSKEANTYYAQRVRS